MRGLSRFLFKTFGRAARPFLKTHGLLQTSKVFNRSALVWEPGGEAVLVIAPHMDDEIIGCGGTLAKHVARGGAVTVVFLTDGAAGGAAPRTDRPAESLAEVRKREARSALSVLGIERLEFLDAADGALAPTPALVDKLRTILRQGRFEVCYLPFFLEEHPDHRAASGILLEAAAGEDRGLQCMGYEIWTALFPNCLVNIDETAPLKREALAHYKSQLAEADYAHTQFGLNAYRSAAFLGGSCRYAEAFCAMPLAHYREMYEAFMHRAPTAHG
jgi:LmbE family N-acetylglucosaminyl deacetylase